MTIVHDRVHPDDLLVDAEKDGSLSRAVRNTNTCRPFDALFRYYENGRSG
ncbi:hypothetical protein GMO_26640 [Gluconobacter morbifer G707]|uniref:Uncharacterized protein n=1 Tax=Gluconobacter morbifer G707 TaxID=1088869 RepID=G6XME6_9PROT|nr:hypothetical protein GMO_26640 [Gluconobacter morbifer G707]